MLMYEVGCVRVGRIAFSSNGFSVEVAIRYNTRTRVKGQPRPCSSFERKEQENWGGNKEQEVRAK